MCAKKTIIILSFLCPLLHGAQEQEHPHSMDEKMLHTLIFNNDTPVAADPPKSTTDASHVLNDALMTHIAQLRDDILKLSHEVRTTIKDESQLAHESLQKVRSDIRDLRNDIINWQDNIANYVVRLGDQARQVNPEYKLQHIRIGCKNDAQVKVEGKVKARPTGADVFLRISPLKKEAPKSGGMWSFLWKCAVVTWVWKSWIGLWG